MQERIAIYKVECPNCKGVTNIGSNRHELKYMLTKNLPTDDIKCRYCGETFQVRSTKEQLIQMINELDNEEKLEKFASKEKRSRRV